MCQRLQNVFLLQVQGMQLVSWLSVVQAEIKSSKIFLVPSRSAKCITYIAISTLRNGTEPSQE